MNSKEERKNIIIGSLIVAIVTMAIGYAVLSQQLKINGTANISGDWDVRMTNITEGTPSNSAGATVTATNVTPAVIESSKTAKFSVAFKTPGDTMEYDITVSNSGSLDAKLSNVVVAATDDDGGTLELTEENGINYEITIDGNSVEEAKNDVLTNSGGHSTIHVKVYWDQNATAVPTNAIKKLSVTLDYEQA